MEDQEKLMLTRTGCLWDLPEKNLVEEITFFKSDSILIPEYPSALLKKKKAKAWRSWFRTINLTYHSMTYAGTYKEIGGNNHFERSCTSPMRIGLKQKLFQSCQKYLFWGHSKWQQIMVL